MNASYREVRSENLRQALKANRITKRQLAEWLFVSTTTVREWLRGDTRISIDMAEEVAEILGVKVNEIVKNPIWCESYCVFINRLEFKTACRRKGLSFKKLAEILGVSVDTIYSWTLKTSHRKRLKINQIKNIAKILDVSYEKLIEGVSE